MSYRAEDRRYARYRHERRGHRSEGSDRGLAHFTYLLFAVGFFTGALTTLFGLLCAYIFKDRRDPLSNSHFDYLIETFWSALFGIIALGFISVFLVLTIVGIIPAVIVWLLFCVWYVLRIARGWMTLFEGEYAPL